MPSMSILALAWALGCNTEPAPSEGAAPSAAPTGMVEVAPEGTRFDPPVQVAQVPDGAWICDMGTVHYAAHAPGKCPICGMELTRKGPAPGGAIPDEHEGHEDHE